MAVIDNRFTRRIQELTDENEALTRERDEARAEAAMLLGIVNAGICGECGHHIQSEGIYYCLDAVENEVSCPISESGLKDKAYPYGISETVRSFLKRYEAMGRVITDIKTCAIGFRHVGGDCDCCWCKLHESMAALDVIEKEGGEEAQDENR